MALCSWQGCACRLEAGRRTQPAPRRTLMIPAASSSADAADASEARPPRTTVKPVLPERAGRLQEDPEWAVLDVRPPTEVRKAALEGAESIPLYLPEDGRSPVSVFRRAVAFFFGGWWSGEPHLRRNEAFEAECERRLPDKRGNVLVCCQKGRRSLTACEILASRGYQRVAWLAGGLECCDGAHLKTRGGADIRRASEGGMSALLGQPDYIALVTLVILMLGLAALIAP